MTRKFFPKAPTREDRMRAWIAKYVKPTVIAENSVQQAQQKPA